jgi:hypothetical protein
MRKRDGCQNYGLHENKRLLSKQRTRDGSQNVGLHENKRWLSKRWFTQEQEMALKTLVYMRM